MSDVIDFMDYTTLASVLGVVNKQVSGMTAAEAEAALGALKNSGLYIANTTSGVLGSNVVNFPGTTAAEAVGEYIAGGGATAASGAAIGTTGDAIATANIAIGQTAIGQAATTVYGVLSMPLPTALAALAPIAGFAIGAGFWKVADPQLYDDFKETIANFLYAGTDGKIDLLPVVADENGNTYYPEAVINAVKDLFSNVGKLQANSDLLNSIDVNKPIPFSTSGFTYMYGDNIETLYKNNIVAGGYRYTTPDYVNGVLASGNPDDITLSEPKSFTHNDKTVYYVPTQIGFNITLINPSPLTPSQYTWSDLYIQSIAWTIIYGDITGGDVAGVNKWDGDSYPDNATPINMLTGYDDNGQPIYTPYYPVSTPIGDPGVSNDPAVNPNPAVNPDPAPVINPVISPIPNPNLYPNTVPVPEPAPVPNPVPEPQPVPDPDVDPSQDTEKTPDKNPSTPKDPIDNGTTPTPIIPTIPILPSAATGLLHVYNPTQSQIDSFGSWLWTTFSGDLIDTLSKLFNDPMDAVIGLHELYASPAVNGSANIRCGYLDSGISANLVGSRYTTINCGSVVVEEYYQNYLDYSPYTNCFIYLPFVGIVPVSSDDIVGNAVNITYHIDSYTGCCIAVVTVAKNGYSSTVYQFEGNCAVEIPISSGYQSSLMSGLLAVAGTAITSSPAVGLTAAHMGKAGLGKNTVQHSGSFGSSYGAMGNKIPYIIVKRPVQKKVYNYSQYYGYPAHKMVYVGNCENYLRAKEVRVTSTTATNLEKDMIVNLLKSGVYVKGDK